MFLWLLINSCENKEEKIFYNDGEIKYECNVINNVKDGVCLGYYSSGLVYDSLNYKNGLINGKRIIFYPTGTAKEICYYVNDTLHGNRYFFYENKKLKKKSTYINGQELGWIYLYNENGDLLKSIEYINIKGEDYQNNYIVYHGDEIDKDSSFYASVNVLNDTVNLNDEIIIWAKLHSSSLEKNPNYMMKIGIGDYDEKFNLKDSSSLSIVATNRDSTAIKIKALTKGLNVIRGFVADDSTYVRGLAYPSEGVNSYFQKQFYVR